MKTGQRLAPAGAPPHPLPAGDRHQESRQSKFDGLRKFVGNQAGLAWTLPGILPENAARPSDPHPLPLPRLGLPKCSSKAPTDLSRDDGRRPVERFDLTWLTLVLIDEAPSALAPPPYRQVERR